MATRGSGISLTVLGLIEKTLILLAMLSLIVSHAFAQKYISWEAEDFNDIDINEEAPNYTVANLTK